MSYTDNFVTALLPLVTDLKSSEKMDFANMLFEKGIMQSDITKTHKVVTGIRHGNVIPIMKKGLNYGAFPFVDPNSCDTNECNFDTKYSHHKWELGLAECKVPICLRNFDENFLMFWNEQKQFINNPDLNTSLLKFISDQVKEGLLGAQWRNVYFGDKSMTSNNLFNGINGFFAQAEANASQVIPIVQNNGTTYAAQQFSSGQQIYDILEQMDALYTEQPWYGTAGVEIKMTRLTASTLVRFLNGLTDTTCCNGIDRVNPDGLVTRSFTLDNLTFRGLKIVVEQDWDNIINTIPALNGGGGANARVNPHRILMTYPENLLIGTSDIESLNMFDIWHSKDDNKVYIKAGTYIGAGIPLKNEYILAI